MEGCRIDACMTRHQFVRLSHVPVYLGLVALVAFVAFVGACGGGNTRAASAVDSLDSGNPNTKLTLIATLYAKPGMEGELEKRILALVAPSRAEAGCINYDLEQFDDDPKIFVLYENWRSKADLDAHFATPYLKDFLAHAGEVVAKDTEIKFYTMRTHQVAPRDVSP